MSGVRTEIPEHPSYQDLSFALLQMFVAMQKINGALRSNIAEYDLNRGLAMQYLAKAQQAATTHFNATAAASKKPIKHKATAHELHDKFATKSRKMWVAAFSQLQIAQAAHNIVVGLLAGGKDAAATTRLQEEKSFWEGLLDLATVEAQRWFQLEAANTWDAQEQAAVTNAYQQATAGILLPEPAARLQRLEAYRKSTIVGRATVSGELHSHEEALIQATRAFNDDILQSINAARKLSREFPEVATPDFNVKHAAQIILAYSKLKAAKLKAETVHATSEQVYRLKVQSTADPTKTEFIHDSRASDCRKHWAAIFEFVREAQYIRERLINYAENLLKISPDDPNTRALVQQRHAEVSYWHDFILAMAAEIKRWVHAELEATIDAKEKEEVQHAWELAMLGGDADPQPLMRKVRLDLDAPRKTAPEPKAGDEFGDTMAAIVAEARALDSRRAKAEAKVREPRGMPKLDDLKCPDGQERALLLELFRLREELISMMLEEAKKATNPVATSQAIEMEIDDLAKDWETFIRVNGNQAKIDAAAKAYLQKRMPRATTLPRSRDFIPSRKDRFANLVHREEAAMQRLSTILRFTPS